MPQRFRTGGAILPDTPQPVNQLLYSSCNSSWSLPGSAFPTFGKGQYRTTSDFVVPRYFKRKAKGEVFFNPYSHVVYDATGSSDFYQNETIPTHFCSGIGNVHTQSRNTGSSWHSEYAAWRGYSISHGSLPKLITVFSDKVVHDAAIEASTACQADRGKSAFNLWEDMAEFNKSLALGADILTTARGLILSSMNSKRVKHAADAWLMWRYGIRPLISSFQGVLDGLKKANGKQRITSRGKVFLSSTLTDATVRADGSHRYSLSERVSEELTVRAMSLDEADLEMNFHLGLSSKGLLTLPWELIRYSFVVDWFANVGDFINAIAPAFGFNQLGSCMTIERKIIMDIACIDHYFVPSTYANMIDPDTGTYRYTFHSKTRYTGLLSAGLKVKEDFRLNNLTRFLDAWSLLMQLLHR